MFRRSLALLATLAGLLLMAGAPARAGLVKCKAADGTVTYTDTSCPPGTSNQDVPPGMGASPSAGSVSRDANQPLSTAAQVFKHKIERCLQFQAEADCRPLDVTEKICSDPEGTKSAQCAAFREAVDAARASRDLGMDPKSMSDARAACAGGNRAACRAAACPPKVYNEGTDDQLRVCANLSGLDASSQWIRFDEHRDGQSTSTTFMCMKRQEKMYSWGARRNFRPQVIVISQARPGEVRAVHKVNTLPDEEFATAGEAATAGCAAEAKRLEQKQPSEPGATARKPEPSI